MRGEKYDGEPNDDQLRKKALLRHCFCRGFQSAGGGAYGFRRCRAQACRNLRQQYRKTVWWRN